jgi:hypothetical protein
MSLALNVMPVVKTVDPVIDLQSIRTYAIERGAKDNTWQNYPAQNLNNSQISITANPPSRDIVVNRRAYIRASFQLTITGTAGANGLMIQPKKDGPRSYPITRSLNTVQCTLNNDQYSSTPNQYWQALCRYQPEEVLEELHSMTPAFPDQFQEFSQAWDPAVGGSYLNALGGYGDNKTTPRGGFSGYQVVSDSGGVAVVNITCCEPVMMSPFNFNKTYKNGFIGVQNMSFVFSFAELSSALWCHDNTTAGHSTITSIVPNITAYAVLLNFASMPMNMPIPQAISWSYYEVVPYSSPESSLAPGASTTLTLQSLQLKSVPKRVYIFAQESLNNKLFAQGGCNKTDTFAAISNLNVTFNNKVGLFSTATQQDLYQLSLRNGNHQNWSAFSNFQGSVIAIEGRDLSLDEMTSSGVIGNFQVTVQSTITNTNPSRTIAYQLWMAVVYEGAVELSNGSFSHRVGLFSAKDILEAPSVHGSIQNASVYGGSFFGDIGSFFKKGYETVAPIAQTAIDVGKKVAPLLPLVGLGSKKGRKCVRAGELLGDGVQAGVRAAGGKMMSRSELLSRLQ